MYKDYCKYSLHGLSGIRCLSVIGWLFTIVFTYTGFVFLLIGMCTPFHANLLLLLHALVIQQMCKLLPSCFRPELQAKFDVLSSSVPFPPHLLFASGCFVVAFQMSTAWSIMLLHLIHVVLDLGACLQLCTMSIFLACLDNAVISLAD